MRLEFGADVPREVQLKRVDESKQPGRKHNHKPSSRVVEKRKAGAKVAQALSAAKFKVYKAKVSAYWRGELDVHP